MKETEFQTGVFVMEKINIIVTGTGSLIGQAIIKSIECSTIKNSLRIIGCDYFANTAGSFWCDKNYILPDLLMPQKIETWKSAIFEIIEAEKVKVLFIGVDFELSYFAELRTELLEKYDCSVIVSGKEIINIGNDKYRTFEFLKFHGLNAPMTVLLEDAEVDNLTFPVVLKPRQGARSRGVKLIKDSAEYKEESLNCFGKGFVVQEAVGNTNTEYTCGLLYWKGEYQNSIILRRMLKEGNTAVAEFHGNAETKIKEYIREIGDVLKPFGSCNLQLRTNAVGEPYLFEINPRFSGTTYMRALFGYNEVEYIIRKVLEWDESKLDPIPGKAYRFYEERLVNR